MSKNPRVGGSCPGPSLVGRWSAVQPQKGSNRKKLINCTWALPDLTKKAVEFGVPLTFNLEELWGQILYVIYDYIPRNDTFCSELRI